MVFCSRAYCLRMCPYQLFKVIRVQVMLILLYRLTDREITDREILISMTGLSCGYSWFIFFIKCIFCVKQYYCSPSWNIKKVGDFGLENPAYNNSSMKWISNRGSVDWQGSMIYRRFGEKRRMYNEKSSETTSFEMSHSVEFFINKYPIRTNEYKLYFKQVLY